MISGSGFLAVALNLALAMVILAFVLAFVRLVRGPSLPDRVIALDLLTVLAVGFIAIVTIGTGRFVYLDVAIALALVGFLATVAFARFIEARGPTGEDSLD